jgi:tetratricopeptide (TPR) repeat protein
MDADRPENVADAGGSTPECEAIRATLARMLAASPFRQAPQLAAFLRFVVEATLAGEPNRIKGYTIATQALGRSADFDPSIDPIVRVEAGRLRRALARYYAGEGRDDPVIIDMQRGGYVPTFRARTFPLGLGTIPASARKTVFHMARRRLSMLTFAALVAIGTGTLSTVSAVMWWRTSAQGMPASIGLTMGLPGTLRPSPFPVVQAEPFDTIDFSGAATIDVDRLRNKLSDALALFDEITVAKPASRPGLHAGRPPPGAASLNEYYVGGTVEHYRDGSANLSFRLRDAADGTIAWTRVFDHVLIADDPAATEIVRKVAPMLAQPFGVIYARELAARARDDGGDPRYRCLIGAIEYWRAFDRAKRAGVPPCLEQVTVIDPTFAIGFATRALLMLREYYEADENDANALLDQALAAAQRAVNLKPHSARAHQALMSALFARGRIKAALAEGERAIALNPYDMSVLHAYAMRLIVSGQVEKGAALLHQAAANYPVRTPVLKVALFLAGYLLDDASVAHQAQLYASNEYPLLLVSRAVAAAKAGDSKRARQAIEQLVSLHPGWRDNARRRLDRYFPSAAIADRLARDLTAAGLAATN